MTKKTGIATRDEAMAKMVELAAEATRLATALAQRDEAIAAVNARFSDEIEADSKIVLGLKAELKEWAKENRQECVDGSKTIRFEGVGEISFRTGNPTVRFARGIDEETAIRAFFDEGMGGYVRTIQQLNREAILAAREDENAKPLFDACGVKIAQSESVLFRVDGVGEV